MRHIFAVLFFAPVISFAAQSVRSQSTPIYKDPSAPMASRVSDLLGRMTLQEKIELVGGNEFSTKANARLGIPELKMTDGPIGVRWGQSTAFPSGISMGASFNRNLIYYVAKSMAVETRAQGRDMLLGPCVGLSRVPFGGRNFESLGEDPYLTAELVAQYTHGLASEKVVGSVKHFGLNDQEYKRMTINSIADERTLHELHLVAFERAVKEGIGTVMASYNKFDGVYASENGPLLTSILKEQWGFKGFVVSDWGATHSTVPAALAGLDLEMPTPLFFDGKLLQAVQNGEVSEALINDKVSRILTQIFWAGLFDGADTNRPPASEIRSAAHLEVAKKLALESMVLLKNSNGLLPFDSKKVKRLAVVGPNADVYVAGGGSSMIQPQNPVTVLQGLQTRFYNSAKVEFRPGVISAETTIPSAQLTPAQGAGQGLYAEYFNNKDLSGAPAVTRVENVVNFYYDEFTRPAPGVNAHDYSVRWTGSLEAIVTGEYELKTISDDGVRLWVDGQLVVDNWTDHGAEINGAKLNFEKGKTYKIRLEYYQAGGGATIRLAWTPPAAPLRSEAVTLAAQSDAVVIAAGFNADLESEGNDRYTMDLPQDQVDLINAIAAVNPHTVVVINTGNPIAMAKWMGNVEGIIYAWYPGEQGGTALAEILAGDYNPSGRLPITMLKRWEDSPAFGTYPEVNGDVVYKEGIYLGYRHFDHAGIAPEFPFGFGLSYTSFVYSDLKVNVLDASAQAPQVEVTMTVTNTGKFAGEDVVQLYVQDQGPKVERPVQELKGFEKVYVLAGRSHKVKFVLDQRSFAYYDVATKGWKADPGRYTVRVGSSSRDIKLLGDLTLK